MLLSLEAEDLADVLGVENPLHRRKLMMAIEDLRDLGVFSRSERGGGCHQGAPGAHSPPKPYARYE